MNVLITGACGFIGRALIQEMERGHDLRLFDRQRPDEATVFSAGTGARAPAPFETPHPFLAGEVTDPEAALRAVEGMDAVVHLAGIPTGHPEEGVETFHVNACGTFTMLDACRRAGVKRFLCASSINAFGTIYWRVSKRPVEYHFLPLDESHPAEPEDPYSLSKLVNEETCAAFTRGYSITTAAFRFAGVWTEEMYDRRLREGHPPTPQWWDDLYNWIHIRDVVRGIRQAVECPTLPEFGVYTLNSADTRAPEPTMDLLERFRPDLIARLTRPLPARAALVSTERAAAAFGFAPQHRLGP
jgi:UDP-glucose 4-epimerase